MDVQTLPKDIQNYIRDLEKKADYAIKVEKEKQQLEIKYQILDEKYKLLIYQKFCKKSETISEDQLGLFTEISEDIKPSELEKIPETLVASHKRKKPGRKPIDETLPREIIEHDIPEDEKICACGCALKRIGEETCEKINVIPEQIWVEKHIRPKYACPACEGTADEDSPAVKITPTEPAIIPKSIVTPGLLAFILINKFVDHLPFYRQENRFERIGIHISRQDMSNWQIKSMNALDPLFDLLKKHIKSGSVLNMDETTVQVMNEPGREDTQKSYMWLGIGGPPGEKAFWYEYKPTRASAHIHDFLSGFSGYLQTDGYQGYETALKDHPGITHVGCFAHARRKFFDASKGAKDPSSPMEGIKWIRKLYELEDQLRKQDLDDAIFITERKKQAQHILDEFKKWLDKKALNVVLGSLMGKAIFYTLDQWSKLTAYLESSELTPDNNISENAIRPFVLGRKNWLFSGSPMGAETSCKTYSLLETAKHTGLDLHKYLRTVFEKAPLAKSEQDWIDLLPWNFKRLQGAV